MTIRLLVSDECLMISGANATSNYEGIRPKRNKSRGGASDSCANNIGIGATLGSLSGIAAGPAGVIGMATLGGITAGLGSCNNSPYNGNNSKGGGRNGGPNYGVQCTW